MVMNSSRENLTNEQFPRPELHTYTGGLILLVLVILESFLIVAANSTVFVLIFKYKKLRRKNNYCLISLAISDFLTGLVVLPLVIVCNGYDESTCTPMDLSTRSLSFSTILHLLVATGERYFKIRYPLRYKYYITGARIALILVAVWVISLSLSLVQLTWIYHPELDTYYDLVFSTSCVVVFAFLPFVITVLANIHVLWIIRKENEIRHNMVQHEHDARCSKKSTRRKSNERKALMVYLAMTVSFMVGFLPYFILTNMDDMQQHVGFGVSLSFLILRYTAPLVDPLLYTFFKTDFKSAVRDMVTTAPQTSERTVQTRV